MTATALIAKNTFVQVLGRVAGTALGLLTLGVMTRYLGTQGYGEFTTVTTFLQFFGIIVDFGLSLTVVAMLSEPTADKDRIASNVFSLRIVSAATFYVLAPAMVLLFPYSGQVKLGVAVGTLSFFFIAVNQILVGVLQRELRMGRAAGAEVLGRFGLLLAAWGVARLGLPLVWMIGALIVGNLLTALWNWLLVRKLLKLEWRAEMPVWKDIVRRSWPIGASIVFNLIYLKGDVIILSLTRTQAEVGIYGAAYKILDVLTVIPIMFMGLVLPLLVKARAEGSAENWRRVMQKAFDFMAILAAPLVAGAWMVGHDLMRFFAGEQFDAAGRMLQILILAAAAVFFGSMFGHAVIAVGKQKPMIWGYAIVAVLATAGYLYFIPRFGAEAAAWVTVGSEGLIAIFTFAMVFATTKFAPNPGTALRAISAALAMAVVLHYLPDIQVLLKVLVGAVIYALVAFIFGAVTKSTLLELLPKPKPAA
jgi:O-antigen/teichoic acid export membrane protein